MKNTYTIAQRNALVEEHLWCIDRVIRKNHALMKAARLDRDDVHQQLALRLIKAVAGFDPDKGVLEQHILAQLQYEMLNCKVPRRLCGISGVPDDFRRDRQIISLESIREDGSLYAELAA